MVPERISIRMQNLGRVYEEMKVQAQDLVAKVKELIHEGNVRRVIIKDDHGNTFMEVPLSIATLSVIAAPVLAAVGAVATLLSNFTVIVERSERTTAGTASATASAAAHAGSGIGATDEQVDMKGTVGQRIDSHGTKLEDLGGVGEHDAKGG
jgi:Domain of unknown function (DUF4342)